MEDLEYSIEYLSFIVPKLADVTIKTSTESTLLPEIKNKLNEEKNRIDQYAIKETNEELIEKYGTYKLQILTKKKGLDKKTKNYFRNAYNYELLTNRIYLMDFRYRLMEIYNIPICTNAWLKCYEILYKEQIIANIDENTIYHFGNCELPGLFLMATNHLVKTHFPNKKYEWIANSYISETRESLEDMYGIYKKYPKQWLMDKDHNGDTKSKKMIDLFREKHAGKYNLYTSDAGISLLFEEFNKQEEVEFHLKMAEILVGLITLGEGGYLIVKFYTFFEKQTIDLFILISMCFEELKIVKPMSSKPANSEVYLVGKRYKKNQKIVDFLYDKVLKHDNKGLISSEYTIDQIRNYADILAEKQIKFIERNLYYFEKYGKDMNNIGKIVDDIRKKYISEKIEYYYDRYVKEYDMKVINNEDNIIRKEEE